MLQILQDTRIPFMQYRRYAYVFSILVMLAGVASLIAHGGFRLGIDFTGGRLIEYRFSQPVSADQLRDATQRAGFPGAEVQEVGTGGLDFMLRLPSQAESGLQATPSGRIIDELQSRQPALTAELRREEVVGPKVGRELRGQATLAVIFALIGILIYIGVRYDFAYAVGGVVALAHNVLVTLLMFSIFNKEVTLTTVAALLTVGGYSINDTVVIFDRIREQTRLMQKSNLADVINSSVNQTLSRTIITSAGVFYAIAALFFLGGEVIHDFAFGMFVGVAFGTYASIYVASALALEMGLRRERIKREKAAAAA